MIAHHGAGRVRLAPGIAFGVPGVAGAYAGTRLSASIRPDLLLSLPPGLMLAAAAAMLLRRRGTAGQHAPAGRPPAPREAAVPDALGTSHCGGGSITPPWTSRRLPCMRRPGPLPGSVLAGPRPSARV